MRMIEDTKKWVLSPERKAPQATSCLLYTSLGYLDGEGHGAAGLEKALDALLTGSGARDTLLCPVTAQGTPVSYTHLDVYKRQARESSRSNRSVEQGSCLRYGNKYI